MKICDICGNESDNVTELREVFKCYEIKEACEDCEKECDKFLEKMNRVLRDITHDTRLAWWRIWLTKFRIKQRAK